MNEATWERWLSIRPTAKNDGHLSSRKVKAQAIQHTNKGGFVDVSDTVDVPIIEYNCEQCLHRINVISVALFERIDLHVPFENLESNVVEPAKAICSREIKKGWRVGITKDSACNQIYMSINVHFGRFVDMRYRLAQEEMINTAHGTNCGILHRDEGLVEKIKCHHGEK